MVKNLQIHISYSIESSGRNAMGGSTAGNRGIVLALRMHLLPLRSRLSDEVSF